MTKVNQNFLKLPGSYLFSVVARRISAYSAAHPQDKVDLIYLCFPNNPTGAVATREQLKVWVDYAHANGAVIL